MPMTRMAIARRLCDDAVAAEPSLAAVVVGGSAARGDFEISSDVDVRILLDGEPAGTYGMHWREGILVDVECEPVSKYAHASELLSDPYTAGFVREAVILFDRNGDFARIQREVADRFADPRWLCVRLAALVEPIERNGREFGPALAEGKWAAACRHLIFAVWTACDALLVSQGVSPSRVRSLQKVGQVLPEERRRIIDVEGTDGLTPEDLPKLRSLVHAAIGDEPGAFTEDACRAAEWMTGNGLHREALHAMWVTLGLELRVLEDSDQGRADRLACEWLAGLGWDESDCQASVARLTEYVAHALEFIGAPGQGQTS